VRSLSTSRSLPGQPPPAAKPASPGAGCVRQFQGRQRHLNRAGVNSSLPSTASSKLKRQRGFCAPLVGAGVHVTGPLCAAVRMRRIRDDVTWLRTCLGHYPVVARRCWASTPLDLQSCKSNSKVATRVVNAGPNVGYHTAIGRRGLK